MFLNSVLSFKSTKRQFLTKSTTIYKSIPWLLGTSDFDAQMSGIKFWKGNENLRPVYKQPFYEILSGCLHFGLFSSQKVHIDSSMRLKLFFLWIR